MSLHARPGLVLLLLAALATPAWAQARTPSIVAGPMAGVSFATLGSANEAVGVDVGTRTGVAAGGFITFNASSHVAIEPQLLYVQKGAKATSGALTLSYDLDYIQIPVLLKGRYWFGNSDQSVTVDPFVGPAIAFNVHCAIGVPTGGKAECSTLGAEASSVDFSGIFGIGVEFAGFTFQGRYDVSFTNAYSSSSSPGAPSASKSKNLAWILTLGYEIPLR
jgi:hypothetical protein